MSEARPQTHDAADATWAPTTGAAFVRNAELAQLRAEIERLRKRELLLMLLLKVATHEPDSATREHSNAPR